MAYILIQIEISPYIDTVPEVRKVMAGAQHKARLGLAKLFLGIDGSVDAKLAQSTGAFFYALLAGVMTQWLPSATAPLIVSFGIDGDGCLAASFGAEDV